MLNLMNLLEGDNLLLVLLAILILAILKLLWKTRRVIWFLLLFLSALAVIFFYEDLKNSFIKDYPWLETTLLVGGATFAVYKFAKKRS